jgi:hypothetical protein
MYDQDSEDDRILGQTTGLLAQRGDEQAVALLVDVRSVTIPDTAEVIHQEKAFDPWISDVDGPLIRTGYRREAVLDVDDHLVPRFTEEVCQRIAETLSYVAERNDVENVAYVRARPALPDVDGDWRRAYRTVRPSTCSANVATGQPGAGQENRRTVSRISTGLPPIAASASRR